MLTIFITGSSSGLGLETIKALLRSNDTHYHIFMGSRSVAKAEEAIKSLLSKFPSSKSTIEPIEIDITDDESIKKAVEDVSSKSNHIDVLVNNAGEHCYQQEERIETDLRWFQGAQFDHQYSAGKMGMRDMWNANYNTNVSSSHIVTEAFMPLLITSSSPRLIFISSGTGSLDEASRGLPVQAGKPPAGWPKPPAFTFTSYRATKAAVNMVMLEWKRILGNDAVKVFAVDPGFLATNLGGNTPEKLKSMGALDPSIGGETVKDVIIGKRDADHGQNLRKTGVAPW